MTHHQTTPIDHFEVNIDTKMCQFKLTRGVLFLVG
jgi:hypothetical protein